MKNLHHLCVAAALGFSLSGCATLTDPTLPRSTPIPPGGATAIIQTIQSSTRLLCGAIPVAATLTGLFTGIPSGFFDIPKELCRAFSTVTLASASKNQLVTVRVRGVDVQMRYVGKSGVGQPRKRHG